VPNLNIPTDLVIKTVVRIDADCCYKSKYRSGWVVTGKLSGAKQTGLTTSMQRVDYCKVIHTMGESFSSMEALGSSLKSGSPTVSKWKVWFNLCATKHLYYTTNPLSSLSSSSGALGSILSTKEDILRGSKFCGGEKESFPVLEVPDNEQGSLFKGPMLSVPPPTLSFKLTNKETLDIYNKKAPDSQDRYVTKPKVSLTEEDSKKVPNLIKEENIGNL